MVGVFTSGWELCPAMIEMDCIVPWFIQECEDIQLLWISQELSNVGSFVSCEIRQRRGMNSIVHWLVAFAKISHFELFYK